MKFVVNVKGLDAALKSTNEFQRIKQDDLNYWIKAIETTARQLCIDSDSRLEIKHSVGNEFQITLKDRQSLDCLINGIQIHLMSMPILLRGMFSKLATNLNKPKSIL
jgi:hypothetical protein